MSHCCTYQTDPSIHDPGTPPLVSCLMPTANRRAFVPRAIALFLAQDHAQKELLILDDGEDSVADLVPAHPQLRYFRELPRRVLGNKRNRLCELARGEILLHWDDDDWSAPDRISRQLQALQSAQADLCGLARVFFLRSDERQAWEYVYPEGGTPWVCGSSLCYTRAYWRRNPFPGVAVGEDTQFVWADRRARLVVMADNDFLVALAHPCNTSPKRTDDPAWRPIAPERLASLMAGAAALPAVVHAQGAAAAPAATAPATPLVSIGVHAVGDHASTAATCAALAREEGVELELFVLEDGPDAAPAALGAQGDRFRRLGPAPQRGAAACFNLMARASTGQVLVFLEAGALPGAGWLHRLLGALRADPCAGLTGPSTNRSWNMQAAFPQADVGSVDATAAEAWRLYGNAVRGMAPLHCLADFCYVVRREVVQAVGAADTHYGLGPCWEMDYTLRATRAGWKAVWAMGAYVYRQPATPQRQHMDAAHFEASRRRYQDKFCGLRLRGHTGAYDAHCSGESCEHFAPPGRIALRIPMHIDLPAERTAAQASARAGQVVLQRAGGMETLVSCIMPTADRRPFVRLALRAFHAQSHANRELIVVDDGDDPVEDLVRGLPQVRYLRLHRRHSIGAKRNIACAEAQGEVIIHWDDDDWYGCQRIAAQIEAIVHGRAHITGLDTRWVLNLHTRQFWTIGSTLHQGMFEGDVPGGTLAYARSLWHPGNRFPETDLAEDAAFLRSSTRAGAVLAKVVNDGHFVYMRHGRNTWQFEAGSFLDRAGWQRSEGPPALLPTSIDEYAAAAGQQRIGTHGVAVATPGLPA